LRVINETKLPDDLVRKVLESNLKALKALDLWPGSPEAEAWVGQNTTIRVQEGQRQGLATNNWLTGVGHFIIMKWPINHRNRNTLLEADMTAGRFPDFENAMSIYTCGVHELGHCLDMVAGLPFGNNPVTKTSKAFYAVVDNHVHEVRARDYERRVVFGLNSEQWKLLQELARACEAVGDPHKPMKGKYFEPRDWERFLTNQIQRYWREDGI